MGLETATYIADLNALWPLGTDQVSTADDHIRLLKSVLQNSFSSGTFTGTLTGCTTSPTKTISYTRSGLLVSLNIPAPFTGISNSTSMTITGIPSAITPTNQTGLIVIPALTDNGSTMGSPGYVYVTTGGVLQLTNANGIFTNANSKGVGINTSFVYALA